MENVSVSVVQGQMNSGGTMLSWNLTAPCRVEAEVWPCQRDAGVDKDRCTELGGIRQRLSNDIWRENDRGHWVRILEHLVGASHFFYWCIFSVLFVIGMCSHHLYQLVLCFYGLVTYG